MLGLGRTSWYRIGGMLSIALKGAGAR
jgi:hypothetical protein